jgi:hypothetical protein
MGKLMTMVRSISAYVRRNASGLQDIGGKAGAIHQAPYLLRLEAMGGGLTAGIVFAPGLCGNVAVLGKTAARVNFDNKRLTPDP